jgi:hypothetical protein
MLVHDEETKQMYCPFKFSRTASAKVGEINQEWICEGLKCMAWQKIILGAGGEGGYCGFAGNHKG